MSGSLATGRSRIQSASTLWIPRTVLVVELASALRLVSGSVYCCSGRSSSVRGRGGIAAGAGCALPWWCIAWHVRAWRETDDMRWHDLQLRGPRRKAGHTVGGDSHLSFPRGRIISFPLLAHFGRGWAVRSAASRQVVHTQRCSCVFQR